MRRINVCFLLAAATAAVLLAAPASLAQFRDTRQLTSNNIAALAGSGDTVWLATERGLNYRTSIHTQEGWPGFEASDFQRQFRGLAFGGGGAAALIYKEAFGGEIGFWHFDHATGRQKGASFRFPQNVSAHGENDGLADPTGHLVYAHGNFWASFGHGGVVRYDPVTNSVRAMRPDEAGEISPLHLDPLNDNDSAKIVTGIGFSADENLLYVAAAKPSTYWTYDFENKDWGAIDTLPPDPVYDAIGSFSKTNDFRLMLAEAGNVANPQINDILFLPRAGGEGTLVVATTTGLYVCEHAKPLTNEYDGGFVLIRHIREVKKGEAYALPGIIRGGSDSRYAQAVFVYKLKNDGDVTINIYDYRMSHVKTIIKGEARSAKSERSTDPARDFWDGTNRAGKLVSPGVYYFKITSTGGDRLFGKVILAK